MQAPCPPEALFAWVDDLGRYPSWLGIVERAEPEAPAADGEVAWTVDLRGKVGPFARSKRLRMVRTARTEPTRAVFERRETDGRHHSAWLLEAEVTEVGRRELPCRCASTTAGRCGVRCSSGCSATRSTAAGTACWPWSASPGAEAAVGPPLDLQLQPEGRR